MSNFDTFFRYNNPVRLSWSPVIEDGLGNLATMGTVSGTSLKWGDHVWITFGVATTALGAMQSAEALLITGLPYSTAAGSTIQITSLDNLLLTDGDSLPRGFIDQGNFPDAIAMQFLPVTEVNNDLIFPVSKWSGTGVCIGSGFYLTND